jgi:hypothetical protein
METGMIRNDILIIHILLIIMLINCFLNTLNPNTTYRYKVYNLLFMLLIIICYLIYFYVINFK